MRVIFFISSVLLLIITTCSAAITVNASPIWSVQTIDPNANAVGNGFLSIAVDSTNNPHIVYQSGLEMAYARWNDSSWNIQKISTPRGSPISIFLDANNNPYIFYSAKDGLAYTTWIGTKQITNVLADSRNYGSFAIDSYGNLNLAYPGGNDQTFSLNFRKTVNGVWSDAQTVVTVKDSFWLKPYRTSLAIDSNNVTYLMHGVTHPGFMNYSYDVNLAVHNNSVWNFQTVASNVNNYGNMVLDSKGYPHLIYQVINQVNYQVNSQNCSIVYASWDGSAWSTQTVASNITFPSQLRDIEIQMGSLALDSRDNPHICYVAEQYMQPGSQLNLNYASWTGTAWNIQIIENSDALRASYLVLDSLGNPHIVYEGKYIGGYITAIMYATSNQPTPTPTPAATSTPSPIPSPKAAVDPLWIAVPVVAIASVAVVAYLWKKKSNNQDTAPK
jgi:hypothetical protein